MGRSCLSPSLACFNGIWLNSCAFWGNQTFPGLCAPFNQANTVVWSCKGSLSMICSSNYQNHFVVCCCSASILQDVTSKSLCYCVFWGGTNLLNRSNIHFPITAETLKTWFWNCKKKISFCDFHNLNLNVLFFCLAHSLVPLYIGLLLKAYTVSLIDK